MSDILQSPFTAGVCLLILFAWVLMLCALFWPRKDVVLKPPRRRKETHDARL